MQMQPQVQAEAPALSLHEAVAEALHSPQTAAAAAQTAEYEGLQRQAGLGLNPRLFLQAEDWRWGKNFDYGSQTENYIFFAQGFETAGKRPKRVALARARVGEARDQEQVVRFGIVSRVAGAYWNAAVLDRIAELLREDMTVVDGMVQYDRERVDAGAMRGVDLLRMQIERDRLQLALSATERDAAQARLELLKQMSRPPSTVVTLSDRVDQVLPVAPVPVDEVLARRADVLQARDAVTASEADVKLQHANAVPNLDVTGGYKRNGVFNTGYSSLQFDLPIRNRNQGEIARAEAAVRLARANVQVTDLRVRAEIAQSEEVYRKQGEIVQGVLPSMRSAAKQNLQLLTEAYRIGGVDLLRFLDAERTEFDVEVSALRSYAEYQQAALRLRLSYGEQP